MKLLTPLLGVILLVSLAANYLLYNRYSTSKPLVRVGDEVITKKMYLDTLEYEAGTPVLRKLVYSTMVLQTASKEGLLPTDQQLDERIDEIERRTPQVLSAVNQNPSQLAQFREDLRTDMALENLRLSQVSATPAEIQAYYNLHKSMFSLPQQVETTMVVTANSTDAQTAELLLQQNQPEDVIARQPRMHVAGVNGFTVNMQALSADDRAKVSKMVFAMKDGDVQTVQVDGAYLTFKVKKASPTGTPPLSQIEDQVARAVKLTKAPSTTYELAYLYQTLKPKFSGGTTYSSEFDDLQSYPLGTFKPGSGQ